MVDSVSAEARRQELLDESLACFYPEDAAGIKLRYKDTSLVLFKEQLKHQHLDNKSFLSFGTRRSSTVSEYGNTPIIVRKSRSANGELSKVAEQWPSMRGRSSVSNYTLHEAREKENGEEDEEENTETEEEVESKVNSSKEDGTDSVVLNEKQQQVDGESVRKISVSAEETEPKVEKVEDVKNANSKEHQEHHIQESDECLGGEVYAQECGNRKSFSQYDLHLQRHKDYIDEELEDDEARGEETQDRENGDKGEEEQDADSMRTVLEVEGVDHKIVLLRPTNKRENADVNVGSKQVELQNQAEGEHKGEQEQRREYNITKRDAVLLESRDQIAKDAILPTEVEDSSVGVSDQNSQIKDDVKLDVPENGSVCSSSDQASSSDWKKIELKIVEEFDLQQHNASANANVTSCTTENSISLTSKLLQGHADDDNDVVFIDDCSQMSSKVEKSHNSCEETAIDSAIELTKSVDTTTPLPPKRQTKTPSESSSPLISKSLMVENCAENGSTRKEIEEVDNSVDADDQNGLLALPVRSPTPPKRSPRRSPRIPKRKEKSQEKVSASESAKDLDHVQSATKPIASASPAMKSKDSNKLFNFSLRKERSRSVSSLSPKKNKERVPTRSESEDTAIVNLRSSDLDDDSKFESSGKRVGVRSMVIDGTIKRNFIVIHPSDDSDTIGLAPLSSFSGNERNSVRASKALSSVKSHISGKSSTKIEIVRKISSKQELREELSNLSKDIRERESLNSDSTTEKSRGRKPDFRKQKDSHLRWSSVSLSSASPHVKTKVLLGSTGGLSEIDCDAINVSSQRINASSTKTTSRLCVVM